MELQKTLSNLCIFYVIRWFEFVAFFQYFCAQQRLKGHGLSMTCNVQRKFPRPLLKKFYHHSYILSCIEETLGEGINFVWKNSNGRLLPLSGLNILECCFLSVKWVITRKAYKKVNKRKPTFWAFIISASHMRQTKTNFVYIREY